ncbi:phage tail tube protein [Longispora fulva]|nr:phage tail tube protein [Longispora fulva]
MPIASYRSILGLGKETTPGTIAAPTLFVPFRGELKPKDHLKLLPDNGMRGSAVKTYDHIPGPLHAEYDWSGDVFADSIGIPLSLLGDVTVTGTPTGSGATTLTAASIVGASSVLSLASIPAGTLVQVDAGPIAEIRTTGTPTGSGPYTIPLTGAPLAYPHATSAALVPVTAPFTHAFSTLNSGTTQPPTWTVTDFNGLTTRQFAGLKFSECALKFNGDGLLEYSAKALSLASVLGTVPVPSYTPVTPMPGWSGTVAIAGTSVTYVVDAEVSIKRPVTPIPAADGSQAPYALWSEEVEVSGKLTVVMEDETELLRYLQNTKPALDINFTQGTGANLSGIRLRMSKCAYTLAEINRGKKYAEITITFEADANVTDVGASGGYSPIKATVTNALPFGTFK